MVTQTYLPSYLIDSIDISDSNDSNVSIDTSNSSRSSHSINSSDSCDSSNSSDQNIARIAKRCPENITSVIKCVKLLFPKILWKFFFLFIKKNLQ